MGSGVTRAALLLLVAAVLLASCGGGEELITEPTGGGSVTEPVRGEPDAFERLLGEAGCDPLRSPPSEGAQHIAPPTRVAYKTDPPTSGSHYSVPGRGPIPTGIHPAPIENEGQVHNLEHGHVGMHYAPGVARDVVSALERVVRAEPTWIFLAPRPSIRGVAFTSWGRLLSCPRPTDAAAVESVAREFVRLFRDKATESIPGVPTGV